MVKLKKKYIFFLVFFIFIAFIIGGILFLRNATYGIFVQDFEELTFETPNAENLKVELNNQPKKRKISQTKAIEDVEYLFSIIENTYGAYEYFGGKQSFNSAKNNIIRQINRNNQTLATEDLKNIIKNNLSFIEDCHLLIDNEEVFSTSNYFSSRKYDFYYSQGYYTLIDGEQYYLKSIDKNSPNKYMKPSINEEGIQVYNIGTMSTTNNVNIPIDIVLESKSNTLELNISLFEFIASKEKYNKSYDLYYSDGIPILKLYSLTKSNPKDDSLDQFIYDAKKLKDEDILVIDLRSNLGGNCVPVAHWFKNFTGKNLKEGIISSGLYNDLVLELSRLKFENRTFDTEYMNNLCIEQLDSYKNKSFYPGWSKTEYELPNTSDLQNEFFVLVDNRTSSAAERFLYSLMTFDNVTIVGTNTKGAFISGNPLSFNLPNSNLRFTVPHKLFMFPDFENIDGKGFQPDLWIKPEYSLDNILLYIKNR